MFRDQPLTETKIVTGGAFRRARESGKTLQRANRKRRKLLKKTQSEDPARAVKALENAQAGGNSSPFISTTKSEQGAINSALGNIRKGRGPREVIEIVGPKKSGVDFERRFKQLGGRRNPDREKDKVMKEIGVSDLFIPPTGQSRSGFEVLFRRVFK